MKLQQLQFINTVVECGLNVSEAAKALHTSQPGVSRYVRMLEDELGVEIFVRERKRLIRLTPVGEEVVAYAKSALAEVEHLRRIATDYRAGHTGSLTVATSHTHARYTLPTVIQRFTRRYPRVRLRLRQGYGSQLVNWVVEGEASLSIGTAPDEPHPDLVLIPCHMIHRVVLTPVGHPLLRKRRIGLKDIAQYPIITYHEGFSALSIIKRAFNAKQIVPNIVLSATDGDVMKAYVRSGLGIAILAHTGFNEQEDKDIRSINVSHLFDSSPVNIGLRKKAHLTPHLLHFIGLFAPHLKSAELARAVA